MSNPLCPLIGWVTVGKLSHLFLFSGTFKGQLFASSACGNHKRHSEVIRSQIICRSMPANYCKKCAKSRLLDGRYPGWNAK